MAQRRSGTAEDLKSCGAILCLEAAAFARLPTASVPLNTRTPLVRDLTSVPAARPTMGWHGQAKQPMLQGALSVLAVVTDAQGALPWTEAATRVWVAAVWLRSMWSGSSAQLASKLVWRPPRHGGVAVPGKVRVSGAGMDPLRSEEASLDRMQGRRSRPAAGGATSSFGRIFEVRRGALAPPLRACIRLKQANSLLQVPMRTQYGLDCMGPATRHAVVATRPACWLAAQSCLTTSTAATQLQPTPWWPPPSKV